MVGLLDRGARAGGRTGKLTGDPAVTTAAVALLNGYGDPLALLAEHPEDYAVAVAVVQEAERLRGEQLKAQADYLATSTANQVIRGVAAIARSALKRRR